MCSFSWALWVGTGWDQPELSQAFTQLHTGQRAGPDSRGILLEGNLERVFG